MSNDDDRDEKLQRNVGLLEDEGEDILLNKGEAALIFRVNGDVEFYFSDSDPEEQEAGELTLTSALDCIARVDPEAALEVIRIYKVESRIPGISVNLGLVSLEPDEIN